MGVNAIRSYVTDAKNFRSPIQKVWIVSDGEKTVRGGPRESLGQLRFRWIETFGSDVGEAIEVLPGIKTPEQAEAIIAKLLEAAPA